MRLKYVLSEVVVGLWRNVTMTIAMIITMAVSLTLLGFSLLLYKQVDTMRAVYNEEVEVSMFLKAEGVTDEQKSTIRGELDNDPLVAEVNFETKDQAYEKFKVLFSNAPDLISLTKSEALPESYRVKLKNPDTFDEFASKYSQHTGEGKPVEVIVDQKKLVEKVFTVLGSLQSLALFIAAVQGLAALMLVINTIQVAAYSKRREVAVMKLVGASNWFIQAPFVLEAVAAGFIGAILAYGSLIMLKIFVFDGALEPLTSVLTPVPWLNVHLMLPILGLSGAVVSSVTGWFALRFYIKV